MTALIGILADMLSDGRPFLFGDTLSAADLAAYHPLWFARGNGGEAIRPVDPAGGLAPWMDRIAAIGHGERTTMTAATRCHGPPCLTDPVEGVAGDDPGGSSPAMRCWFRPIRPMIPSAASWSPPMPARSWCGTTATSPAPSMSTCRDWATPSCAREMSDAHFDKHDSPYARIARIALGEKGFDLAGTEIVNPWEDAPALLALNSAARVPTLETDAGCRSPKAC